MNSGWSMVMLSAGLDFKMSLSDQSDRPVITGGMVMVWIRSKKDFKVKQVIRERNEDQTRYAKYGPMHTIKMISTMGELGMDNILLFSALKKYLASVVS